MSKIKGHHRDHLALPLCQQARALARVVGGQRRQLHDVRRRQPARGTAPPPAAAAPSLKLGNRCLCTVHLSYCFALLAPRHKR